MQLWACTIILWNRLISQETFNLQNNNSPYKMSSKKSQLDMDGGCAYTGKAKERVLVVLLSDRIEMLPEYAMFPTDVPVPENIRSGSTWLLWWKEFRAGAIAASVTAISEIDWFWTTKGIWLSVLSLSSVRAVARDTDSISSNSPSGRIFSVPLWLGIMDSEIKSAVGRQSLARISEVSLGGFFSSPLFFSGSGASCDKAVIVEHSSVLVCHKPI